MSKSFILVLGSVGGVMACTAEEVPIDPASKQTPSATLEVFDTPEPIDPFYLAVEAERWGVMIDNARNVPFETRVESYSDDDGRDRIQSALYYGIRSLINLRDETVRDGVVSVETAAALTVPDWAYTFESNPPSLEVLQARSDWLGAALQPFVDAKCRTKEGDGWRPDCVVE